MSTAAAVAASRRDDRPSAMLQRAHPAKALRSTADCRGRQHNGDEAKTRQRQPVRAARAAEGHRRIQPLRRNEERQGQPRSMSTPSPRALRRWHTKAAVGNARRCGGELQEDIETRRSARRLKAPSSLTLLPRRSALPLHAFGQFLAAGSRSLLECLFEIFPESQFGIAALRLV